MAVGALGMATAQAGGRGDKIQFSQPGSATAAATSNLTTTANPGLDRLNPTPGGIRQVQDDLFRPLKDAMPSAESLQGGMSLPAPAVQQSRPQLSKHAREMMERRRNWAFADMNDLTSQPSMEESLGLKDNALDGKENISTSLIQRYYERQKPTTQRSQSQLQQQQLGVINGTQKPDFTGAAAYNPLLSQIPGIQPSSFGKSFFGSAQETENSDKPANLTFNGTGKFSQYSTEELAAQKHRAEFSHLLDPTLPVAKPTGNNFRGTDSADLYGRAGLFGQGNQATPAQAAAAKPYRSAIYPVGITDPAHSSIFNDPTAVALGMPNPVSVKTTTLPVTAEAVQKMLDPFTANMPKRKF